MVQDGTVIIQKLNFKKENAVVKLHKMVEIFIRAHIYIHIGKHKNFC